MFLEELNFDLPQELIAQTPVEPRDSARLLVYERVTRTITHRHVSDLPKLVAPGTTIIANDSKVRKSRLVMTRHTGGKGEILVLGPIQGSTYEVLLRGKHIKPGEVLVLDNGHKVTAVKPHEEAHFTSYYVDFHLPQEAVERLCEELGSTPLPPYIAPSNQFDARYQTVYAGDGELSAAAPTAGLHFTPELIEKLQNNDCDWETVTLAVGMGTFQPLKVDRVEKNTLHSEKTFVTPEVAEKVNKARGHILAIGTTSCRTLESHVIEGEVVPGARETSLFIYPGYQFKAVNQLMTNFHLPKSSLLLLVAALIGSTATGEVTLSPEEAVGELLRIYQVAIDEKYRFFSFGDAMLVL